MGNALGGVTFFVVGAGIGYLLLTGRLHIGSLNTSNSSSNSAGAGSPGGLGGDDFTPNPALNVLNQPFTPPAVPQFQVPTVAGQAFGNNVMAPVHMP